MFQIAAAYAYAKRYGMHVGFNCAESSGPHHHVTEYVKNILKGVELYHVRKSEFIHHSEKGFHYQEIPNYKSNVVLNGYFQSEKYFKDYEDEIRELFMSYDIELSDELKGLINNENSCSIHVRRGDFLKYPNNHPVQNMNYFLKAIKQMPKDSVFLIFSDDIDWVFLADNATAAATRRIVFYEYNKTTSEFTWKGFITLIYPAATNHTIRGFRVVRELYTTGTVGVSGTAVTGSGSAWNIRAPGARTVRGTSAVRGSSRTTSRC
jgi:hypothetical protein